jgi:hypothetical protein
MRSVRATCAVTVLLAWLACGGRDSTPQAPGGSSGAAGVGTTSTDPDAKLTDAECGTMLDHIVDIGHAEQKRTLAPEAVPTDEQIADVKQKQRAGFTQQCLSLPRSTFQCAMRAQTPAELQACDPPKSK